MPTGARHARSADSRERRVRLSTLLAIWLAGLAAGFFGILASFARYGCGAAAQGLGCSTSGTVLGALVIIAVVALVTAVTVVTFEREPRRVLVVGAIGLAGLGLCYLAAQALLSTV